MANGPLGTREARQTNLGAVAARRLTMSGPWLEENGRRTGVEGGAVWLLEMCGKRWLFLKKSDVGDAGIRDVGFCNVQKGQREGSVRGKKERSSEERKG